jgi:hypothetical protein
MSFSEKMMEGMMGGMKPEKMKEMMDQFFSAMPADDKQNMMDSMMETFMGAMSQEDKQAMMQKVMAGVTGVDANPIKGMGPSMMGGNPGGMMGMMMNMMSGMMDGAEDKEMPWDMCRKMMGNIGKASDLAAYATPELRTLFEEWLEQINDEVVAFIKKEGKADPATIADHFKISRESIHYILGKLAQSGRINLKAEI